MPPQLVAVLVKICLFLIAIIQTKILYIPSFFSNLSDFKFHKESRGTNSVLLPAKYLAPRIASGIKSVLKYL